MAASSSPVRIEAEIFEAAKLVGETMSRSAAQQLAHWARIGREIEASGTVSQRDIARVLSGRLSYDELDAESQALVRAEWAERIAERRRHVDLVTELGEHGRVWIEVDAEGKVVERSADD